MNNILEIIPSPGTDNKTWEETQQKIELVKSFAKTIHIDVVDGKFAPTVTFSDPQPFIQYTSEILFEVHLMVEEPIEWIERFGNVGFKRFIGQVEKMSDREAFIQKARQYGEGVLALDAQTSVNDLPIPLPDTDGFLVMTVHAGLSGQQMQEPLLQKVMKLHPTNVPIEVDGGMNAETIVKAKDAGAQRFVVTSALYAHTPAEQYEILRQILAA
jgi:ribulose-phosphate 3-epimerase